MSKAGEETRDAASTPGWPTEARAISVSEVAAWIEAPLPEVAAERGRG